MSDSTILLSRDVTATRIPQGDPIPLTKGTAVVITQALGGSYTVAVSTENGLFRIAAEFADALGQAAAPTTATPAGGGAVPVSEEAVWGVLRTCYDPEIPVNIVDLGLIYSLLLEPAPTQGTNVTVKMTLTAPGCGMGPVIAREAQQKILGLGSVTEADVQVVWDPPWSPDLISAEGKKKLGMG